MIEKIISSIKSEYNYFQKRPTPVFFDHIPKCAGTTINKFLKKYYPSRLRFGTGVTMDKVNEFKKYSKKKRDRYKWVSGHLANLLVDHVRPDAAAVVVFREPTDRIVSHYYYVQRRKGHRLYKQVFVDENIALRDYCSKIDNEELRNYYVRRYSGLNEKDIKDSPDKAIKQALENIARKYDLVGFQDKIPDFMEKLIEKINLPKESYTNKMLNKTSNRASVAEIDIETIKEIRKYNSLDVELYAKLRERFL